MLRYEVSIDVVTNLPFDDFQSLIQALTEGLAEVGCQRPTVIYESNISDVLIPSNDDEHQAFITFVVEAGSHGQALDQCKDAVLAKLADMGEIGAQLEANGIDSVRQLETA